MSTLRDLRQAGCQIVTIGQYLRPVAGQPADVALLHAGRVRGPQADRARPGVRPRRVWPARPEFLPRPRADASLRQPRRALTPRAIAFSPEPGASAHADRGPRRHRRLHPLRAAANLLHAGRRGEESRASRRQRTGRGPFQASAIRVPACSSSALRRRPTARTGPAGSSRGDGVGGSGDFLMRAMHAQGFASIPTSHHPDRWPAAERRLHRGRRPLRAARQQADAARDRRVPRTTWWRSWRRCRGCRVIVALGRIAFEATWRLLDLAVFRHPPTPRVLARRSESRRRIHRDRLVSPLAAEHEHRAADADDARGRVSEGEGDGIDDASNRNQISDCLSSASPPGDAGQVQDSEF